MNNTYARNTINYAGFDMSNQSINIAIEGAPKLARVRMANYSGLMALAQAADAPRLLAICEPFINGQQAAFQERTESEEEPSQASARYQAKVLPLKREASKAIATLGTGYMAALSRKVEDKQVTYSIEQFTPSETGENEFGELETRDSETFDFIQLHPEGATEAEIEEVEL
jgi:hypothetical protein